MAAKRRAPNILVTGTPGTGKSTTCEQIAEATQLRHINVGDWVKDQGLHCGWDDEHQSYLLDEDKVCDALEDHLSRGGNIVDHHSCDFFPERWFDLVLVLQTDNSLLYDRLKQRGYEQEKITENVECEIMHVIIEEARNSYREEIVRFLESNTVQDMDSNVERTVQWVQQYIAAHAC